ncbi:pyridoxal-phosphate dependent enzyme [Salipiger bermudensis]|uniref:pyridoxal-phosphate dependent enzyme n=1 Tax=Salipiger bermudensis TaxID=344736 RepID=UPI001CD727B6|nr:pyridoxal-phosphate dependent enzyme [Salipiger bermudensis]MCA0963656.1 pyridoxal-phosphate dependent enzyme [Salipiger bermudensis]
MTLLDPAPVRARLARCPNHAPTPLHRQRPGGRPLWIKDERTRMGLGSFKALGGAYAVLRLIEARGRADVTFVTASAGNHGLSVAAGARVFGAKARIHIARTVSEHFADRLRAEGATVVRSGDTYEASIAAAIADAEATGAIHLADGSWPGYTEPPRLVMEGYTVIAEELREAFKTAGPGADAWPDIVYLQAGVGGLAAAMAARIRAAWPVQPRIVVIEPEAAPCLRESMRAGRIITVDGPVSKMGRLDCKTPSLLAFDILRETADAFETVSEAEAAAAFELMAAEGLATTPSGAAGVAGWMRMGGERPLVILSEGPVAG